MSAERIAQLQSILATAPDNTFARYALGMEYSSQGETEKAIEEFRNLLAQDGNYTNAYFMAAQALQHADRTDEAIEWLRNGLTCAERTGNRHAGAEMQALLDELEG